MDLSNLRTLLLRWLPIFIILMILLGMALFAVRTLVPRWQSYQVIASNVEGHRSVVATQLAEQNDTTNQIILQHQIDKLQADLLSAGTTFLRRSEAEEVLNRLYNYAYGRGVRVVNLQAQSDTNSITPAPPYETLLYQVQVAGAVTNLIDFIAHFKEASLPAVNIVSMSALGGADSTTLTMMLQFYTSQYASGQILSVYPTPEPILASPTPTETPTVAPIPPTEAPPTSTLTPSPVLPSPTPTSTLTPTLIPTTAALTADTGLPTEEVVVCPGAPPTLFKPGDIAIVDFNGLGALRVLSDPNAPITSTRTQAYDNQRLEIITGPVCANATYYWYVRNLSQDNALGWVGEGRGEERWLCPEANPECVP